MNLDITQVPPVDEVKRIAVDIRKEVTCLLIKVKKERKSPLVPLGVPNLFYVHKNKKIKAKDNNQNSVDAASLHKTNKIKLKDNNQNNVVTANNIFNCLVAHNKTTEIIDVDNNQGIEDDNKCNVHVPVIIDVKSQNIDVELSVLMLVSTIIPLC